MGDERANKNGGEGEERAKERKKKKRSRAKKEAQKRVQKAKTERASLERGLLLDSSIKQRITAVQAAFGKSFATEWIHDRACDL